MSDSIDVHGLPAKWRAEAEDCDAKAREREAESPRNGQWFRGCANGHRLAADEIDDALRQSGEAVKRDREADRARFSDSGFNDWLDTGISDAGHTVWDAVGDTQAAWAGWEARQFAGDAVLLTKCCGREECGGECGNQWLGMDMYRKPAALPATSGLVEALREALESGDDGDWQSARNVIRAALAAHDASIGK